MAENARAVLAKIKQEAAEFLKTQTLISGAVKDIVFILSADKEEIIIIRVDDKGRWIYETFAKQKKPANLSTRLEGLMQAGITDQRAILQQVAAREEAVKAALGKGG